MRTLVKLALLLVTIVGVGNRAEAAPVLQLSVVGGHYDSTTQTIVSNGPTFTLVALLTPKPGDALNTIAALLDTYYISAALVPQTGPTHSTVGSFTWNGVTYDATEDMTYGVPPIEAASGASEDPGDLSRHGVYPTFFREFAFQFSPTSRTTGFNSAENPNGLDPTSDLTGTFYRTFEVATSFPAPYQLHFDLYDTHFRLQGCGGGSCRLDEDIHRFAPFSHDAQSGPGGPAAVPEPASLLLLGAGLGLSARQLRRRAPRS